MATEAVTKSPAGFAPSLMKNLSYPFTSTERRIHTLAIQELTEADDLLSRHLGSTHPIRKNLTAYLDGLRERL